MMVVYVDVIVPILILSGLCFFISRVGAFLRLKGRKKSTPGSEMRRICLGE